MKKSRFQFIFSFAVSFLFISIKLFAQNADFTADVVKGCSPLIVNFTITSPANPTNIVWDFGNVPPFTTTSTSVANTYFTTGLYNITLTCTDANGIQSTITKTGFIQVYKNPQPIFLADPRFGCPPQLVNFYDATILGDTTLNTWLWDFGTGVTSTMPNPTYTYANAGNYRIKLVVVDNNGCSAQTEIANYIQIRNQNLNANFSSNDTLSCGIPFLSEFTADSIPNAIYNWTFGDGGRSNEINPSHLYTSPGNYSVGLIVTLGSCRDTVLKRNYIKINDSIQLRINESEITSCVNKPISFSYSLSGNLAGSPTWSFSNGNTTNETRPIQSFGSPGDYFAILTYTTPDGCSLQDTSIIHITEGPDLNIDFSLNGNCQPPFTVNINANSSQTVAWSWVSPNSIPNTANISSPIFITQNVGPMEGYVIITDVNGCTTRANLDTIINTTPLQAIIPDTLHWGCVPSTISFLDESISSSNITTRNWTFVGGNPSSSNSISPSVIYNSPGTYPVTLSVTNANGCISTDIDSVHIGSPPIVNFSATPRDTCAEIGITFTNLSTNGDRWFWEFGDGGTSIEQNPNHLYADTGYFDVKLTIWNNGCISTLEIPNYIHITPPIPGFTISRNCNTDRTFIINENSIGADSLFWEYGDGTTGINFHNHSHTYTNNGTYTIKLTVFNFSTGCSRSSSITFTISDPIINFDATPTNGCAALSTLFNNTAFVDSTFSFLWKFGDGATDTSKNPLHTYNLPGIYDVTLILIDEYGCKDSLVRHRYITVNGLIPNANIQPAYGCPPLLINFNDNTLGAISWLWDFGDGNISNSQNISHTYTLFGQHDIKLIVSDGICTDSTLFTNIINVTAPEVNFSISDTIPCLGGDVRFVNNTIEYPGLNYQYEWDFGDGTTDTVENPVHTFNSLGLFTIRLRVIQNGLCDSFITKTLRVVEPIADFIPRSIGASCPPLLVNFTDLSQYAVEWYWNFGDGGTSRVRNPSHVYSIAGTYTVTLIIKARSGCYDTLMVPDVVRLLGPRGTFTFSPIEGCIPLQTNFTANIDSATRITWNFGGGVVRTFDTITNIFNISHHYNTPGNYLPSVILQDNNGCVVSLLPTDTIKVGNLIGGFKDSIRLICENGTTFFTDTSFAINSNIVQWNWDFGDGVISNIQNPQHNYSSPGLYDVSLIVENNLGCIDTIIKPNLVRVAENPNAEFIVSDSIGCVQFTTNFSGSINYNAPGGNYYWNFGDGTSNLFNTLQPIHTYMQDGQYNSVLYVENLYGCIDSFVKPITVLRSPFTFAGNDTSVCIGERVQLNSTSSGISFTWTPRDYLSCYNCSNPFIENPQQSTMYYLESINNEGCVGRDTINLTVIPKPILTALPTSAICNGDSIQLFSNANPSTNIVYRWTPQRDLSCYDCPNPIAFPQQNTLFSVSAGIGNLQCTNSDTVLITVNERPDGYAFGDTLICNGSQAYIHAVGGLTYQWHPANSLNNPTISNPIASPVTSTNYIVDISNGLCSIYDTVKINVRYNVNGEAYPDTIICVGDKVTLRATGGNTYHWIPDNIYSNPFDSITTVIPTQNTIYPVIISNSTCIPDTQYVNIQTLTRPTVNAGNDTIIIRGQSITLYPNSDRPVRYEWTPNNTLSCFDCRNPIASPFETTTYIVTGYDANNCSDSDDIKIQIIDNCSGDIVLVPNAFTPNNDGKNDILYVRGQLIASIKIFRIYNRWGELIFETDDINTGWDGTFKGQNMNSGVYVYYVEAICIDGKETLKKGNVTLIK